MIYRYLLKYDHGILLHKPKFLECSDNQLLIFPLRKLALLLTCKLINEEASVIFYRENTFKVHEMRPKDLSRRFLGLSNASLFRNITFSQECNFRLLAVLNQLTALHTLRLYVPHIDSYHIDGITEILKNLSSLVIFEFVIGYGHASPIAGALVESFYREQNARTGRYFSCT
jgi:hypothetical protein